MCSNNKNSSAQYHFDIQVYLPGKYSVVDVHDALKDIIPLKIGSFVSGSTCADDDCDLPIMVGFSIDAVLSSCTPKQYLQKVSEALVSSGLKFQLTSDFYCKDNISWEYLSFKAPAWSGGSGMVGCLYDNGPIFADTKEEIIEAVLFPWECDTDFPPEEYDAAVKELRTNNIYYFKNSAAAGADYVEVCEYEGVYPEDDE